MSNVILRTVLTASLVFLGPTFPSYAESPKAGEIKAEIQRHHEAIERLKNELKNLGEASHDNSAEDFNSGSEQTRSSTRPIPAGQLKEDILEHKQEIREDRAEHRQEIREDRLEHRQSLRSDNLERKQDVREDKREHRQDIRDNRIEHHQEMKEKRPKQ